MLNRIEADRDFCAKLWREEMNFAESLSTGGVIPNPRPGINPAIFEAAWDRVDDFRRLTDALDNILDKA